MNRKVSIARLSVISNTLLIIIKFCAGFYTGSVSIISEAIHSMMDLVAAVIAFFAVKFSDHPADDLHPYGHGKYENVSGVVEALLIFVAAIWIIYEAVEKILNPHASELLFIGMIVMFVSAVVNFFVSKRLYKVAKETDSIALEADALHLKTDVYTSLGVCFGLLMIQLTGITILDPICAIIVALMIIRESYHLLKRAFNPLLDTSLDKPDLELLKDKLESNSVLYHDLKTRKSGNNKFVEFHMELPKDLTLIESHKRCDEVEEMLKKTIQHLTVIIHVEPKAD